MHTTSVAIYVDEMGTATGMCPPATTNENRAYGMFCNLSLMFNQYLIDPYCAILHYSASITNKIHRGLIHFVPKSSGKGISWPKINRFQLKLIIKENNHYLPDQQR